VINVLREADIQARPVYGMTLQRHWTLEPGGETAAEVFSAGGFAAHNPAGSANGVPRVGVVDAGFLDPSMPTQDQITDFDLGEEFHGAFVADIIRRIAPSAGLRLVEVPLVTSSSYPPGNKTPETQKNWLVDGEPSSEPVSDEIAVYDALITLLGTDPSLVDNFDPTIELLNLSLGTYACPVGSEGELQPPEDVERVLAGLAGAGIGIAAAGGNEAGVEQYLDDLATDLGVGPLITAFYPAASQHTFGVGSFDVSGTLTSWENGTPVPDESGLSWETHAAGIDLIGLFLTDDSAVVWSGTSFAAAVFTGLLARGLAQEPPNSAVVETPYEDVPGLVWSQIDDNGVMEVCYAIPGAQPDC